ncbi:MAG TPA: hypothetical protein VII38_08040, partial [Polyangia bacterium]
MLAPFAILFAGCLGGNPSMTPGGAGGQNGNGSGANGATGSGSGSGEIAGCGKMTFPVNLNQATPNVMLVVDESGSMQDTIPGTNQSKWSSLKSAVQSLLSSYDGKVNWGLSIFPHPGGQSCTP